MLFNCFKLFFVGMFVFFLSSCSFHMSRSQCLSADWYAIGIKTGTNGLFRETITQSVVDCKKYNIDVNLKAYDKGWDIGIKRFCRPSIAYELGLEGKNYNGVCPGKLNEEFQKNWNKGIRLYCIPSTGYNLGRSGANFPNFCPEDLFMAFKNAYDNGRSVYNVISNLKGQSDNIEEQIMDINIEISNKNSKMNDIRSELSAGVNNIGQSLSAAERENLRVKLRDLRYDLNQLVDQKRYLENRQSFVAGQQAIYSLSGNGG